MKNKGFWSGILKQHKRATKGIFLPKPLCATNVRDLKVQLQHNSQSSPKPRATFAFYRVSHVLSKHEKPFKDGSIVKEAFLEAADSLFFKNEAEIVKSKKVEVSRNTRHAKECLCKWRSVRVPFLPFWRVDWYVAQLCLFISMVSEDMTAKKRSNPSLLGYTREKDIFNIFVGFVKETKLPLSNWCWWHCHESQVTFRLGKLRSWRQGRYEGGKGTIPMEPNHCGGRRKVPAMSHVGYFLQYCAFASNRPQVLTWGEPNLILASGAT